MNKGDTLTGLVARDGMINTHPVYTIIDKYCLLVEGTGDTLIGGYRVAYVDTRSLYYPCANNSLVSVGAPGIIRFHMDYISNGALFYDAMGALVNDFVFGLFCFTHP